MKSFFFRSRGLFNQGIAMSGTFGFMNPLIHSSRPIQHYTRYIYTCKQSLLYIHLDLFNIILGIYTCKQFL